MYTGTIKHTAVKHRFVGCRVYRSTAQSLTTATNTDITFDSETFDTDGFHSTVSNTERITIPTGFAGYYRFSLSCGFASHATGVRQAHISFEGTTGLASYLVNAAGGGNSTRFGVVSPPVNMSVGNWVKVILYQDSGTSLNTESGAQLLQFSCEYLGAA